MNVCVVGNVNLAPLSSRLADHDVTVLDVGALATALSPTGPISGANAPAVVIVHVDAEVLFESDDAGLVDFVLANLASYVKAHPATLVVANTLWATHVTALSHAAGSAPGSDLARRAHWDSALLDLAASLDQLVVLDLPAVFAPLSRSAVINWNYWYLGRIRYTNPAFDLLGAAYTNVLDGARHQSRKVLVLDLDNTLWGGVLGEEGAGGLALSEDGVGKCYRDLQREIRRLAACGVLLAVASKNDADDALAVINTHPMMLIRGDDLVAYQIGWGDKAGAIQAIADELNLGLDSFVFLDDNPVERALVGDLLPAVAVPDFPERPELLHEWFVTEVVPAWFPRTTILAGDADKTAQYQTRQRREVAQGEAHDLEHFLSTLDMVVSFHIDPPELTERLAQLTQKTNQFNLTTLRATPAEVRTWIDSPDHLVVACSYRDRFGDDGIVGLAIVDTKEARLLNLLLSCRVLGRGVEQRLLDEVRSQLHAIGHERLTATFVPSERNSVAASFLSDAGFTGGTHAGGVFTGTAPT